MVQGSGRQRPVGARGTLTARSARFRLTASTGALYWGEASHFESPLLAMEARTTAAGVRGVTTIFGREFDTTGVFGASGDDGSDLQRRGLPSWLTVSGNRWPVPIANGAPVRMRIERQPGYKMAKYVMRIELVQTFEGIRGGKGSYWADRGYEWYAGI